MNSDEQKSHKRTTDQLKTDANRLRADMDTIMAAFDSELGKLRIELEEERAERQRLGEYVDVRDNGNLNLTLDVIRALGRFVHAKWYVRWIWCSLGYFQSLYTPSQLPDDVVDFAAKQMANTIREDQARNAPPPPSPELNPGK